MVPTRVSLKIAQDFDFNSFQQINMNICSESAFARSLIDKNRCEYVLCLFKA